LSEKDGWNLSDRRSIAHFSLPPGQYDFQVETSLNGTTWHPIRGLGKFEIGRPWWGTWVFRFIIGLSLVLVGFTTYRMRVNSVRRKQNYLELINSHQQRLIDSEIQTQERERKRIAKDLHDGVGTSLSSIKLFLSNAFEGGNDRQSKMVREIDENLSEVIAEIKRIVYDLHPPALERYGLQVGLKNLVENINSHNQLRIYFDYYGQREVTPKVSTTIYRIIQELLNNTLKHAKATEVRIHINHFEDEINIMYEDNGIGMVGSRFTGLGLHSIESRVRSLQGKMSWESNHKGTFYNFDVPIA
jgi:signal transduction histidine kinase